MKNEEQIYTIPLGKAYDYKRTKRAIRAVDLLREFAFRHSKAQEIIISMNVNEFIWARSIQKPPRKIKVKIVKKGEVANVYLPDEKIVEEKPVETKKAVKEEKKEETKPKEVKEEKIKEVKTEKKTATKEEKPIETKKAVKEEKKEENKK